MDVLNDNEENHLRALRPTINPYGHALKVVCDRIKWDLHVQSWISRKRLGFWKDRYSGGKAVIICNGPSLLKSDLSLLKGVFTFGLNKINLLFDKSDFRPSCIVAMNPFVIDQNCQFFNETNIPLFLDRYATKTVRSRNNIIYLHSAEQQKFARDCSISVFQGYTVTFVAMQLAFHMGFKDVALIGCDHNFAVKGQSNKVVVSGVKDESHFDPNYFAGGARWQLPDLMQSEVAYALARDMYESYGRKIVNATEGGNLEIFERYGLTQFLS